MQIELKSPQETAALGKLLGSIAEKGDVICLLGDLGTGKTTLAQGIGLGLGIYEHINSPTFTFIHEYQGRIPFFHMDLYRLACLEEGEELGLTEYFYGNGVSVVEWPMVAAELLPQDILTITLTQLPEGRIAELDSYGTRSQQIIKEVSKLVDSKH